MGSTLLLDDAEALAKSPPRVPGAPVQRSAFPAKRAPAVVTLVPTRVHSLALVYLVDTERGSLSSSMEVQNPTDEDAYDFFGLQRPGRAFSAKMTFEMRREDLNRPTPGRPATG